MSNFTTVPGPGGASGSPLVTIGLFAAVPEVPAPSEVSRRQVAAMHRYARQQVAIDVMGYNAVRYCLRRRIDRHMREHTLYHSARRERARLDGLMTCHQVWVCPVCGHRISEQKRADVEEAIINHRLGGGSVLFLTFTAAHGPSLPLAGLLDNMVAAYRSMAGHWSYRALMADCGSIGSIRALEATWGASNGFHPHMHGLLFLRPGVEPEALRTKLYPLWRSAAARRGLAMNKLRGLAVQSTRGGVADYFAKWGVVSPAGPAWGPESEMTCWPMKSGRPGREARYAPFELLDQFAMTGERVWALRFREFASAYRRRSQLQWSRGLRGRLLEDPSEVTDEELAGRADDDETKMGVVLAERYRRVVVSRRVKQFFAAAHTGDMAAVEAVLAESDALVSEREREGEDTYSDIF